MQLTGDLNEGVLVLDERDTEDMHFLQDKCVEEFCNNQTLWADPYIDELDVYAIVDSRTKNVIGMFQCGAMGLFSGKRFEPDVIYRRHLFA